MTIQAGKTTDIIEDTPVVKGCTISSQIFKDGGITISIFSLAAKTSISASSYENYHLITVRKGVLKLAVGDRQEKLEQGESLLTPKNTLVGLAAAKDSIYTEIALTADAAISSLIQPGKAFRLDKLIPYEEGRIVNCDLISGSSFKLALMALSPDSGLAEHSAPGNAMIFSLAGKGIVNYEGEEKVLEPGNVLKMTKGARHSVDAAWAFKMALLVMTPAA